MTQIISSDTNNFHAILLKSHPEDKINTSQIAFFFYVGIILVQSFSAEEVGKSIIIVDKEVRPKIILNNVFNPNSNVNRFF